MSINLECKQCKHVGNDFVIDETGIHRKASCGKCGAYIKNLSKDDKYGTKEQRAEIWDKTKGCCAYCGVRPNPERDRELTYDHIDSQHNGGGHNTENLMISCFSCNASKGKKSLEEYRFYIANKLNKDYHFFWFEQMNIVPPKHVCELLKLLNLGDK